MITFSYIAAGFATLYVLFKTIYAIALLQRIPVSTTTNFPFISILLAARNEQANIESCLKHLASIDYPIDKLEIIIGDDFSEDETGGIIRTFIAGKNQFKYFLIEENLSGIQGKQNVLAQLVKKSKGKIILVTDADIAMNPRWARLLVAELNEDVGMVCGPTLVEGNTLFAKMQSLDWLMGITIMRAHSNLGIPITGVGNNMAFTREAYETTGGYENMPFSITEDYLLFERITEKGFKFKQLFNPNLLNISQPLDSFSALFSQRKRWFSGAKGIAWYNKLFILFNASIMPVLIGAFVFLPIKFALICYTMKILADFLLLLISSLLLRKGKLIFWFPIYEIYYQLLALIGPIFQLIPGKIKWKGRNYG